MFGSYFSYISDLRDREHRILWDRPRLLKILHKFECQYQQRIMRVRIKPISLNLEDKREDRRMGIISLLTIESKI